MLRAVTIGYPHDSKKPPVVITGPEVLLHEHLDAAKKIASDRIHPTLSRVEIWDSMSGVRKTYKFLSKEESERRAKAAKAEAEADEEQKKSAGKKNAEKTNDKK